MFGQGGGLSPHLPVAIPLPIPANSEEELDALKDMLFQQLSRLQGDLTSMLGLLEHVSSYPTEPAAGVAAPIEVRCLGTFRCDIHGRAVERWHSGRARGLFQYLLVHHDRPVQRDVLLNALWPDPRAAAPRTSLKVALHALRQTLTDGRSTDAGIAVDVEGINYRLSVPGLWLDVEEFERCYTAGRTLEAQGRQAEALGSYTRAAALYRGDFLEDVADDWPMFRRQALIDQLLHILATLAEDAYQRGEYQEAIGHCQQMLAKDECREDTYRLLMACHGRLGQPGRVQTWYERCVTALRQVLDVAPEEETEVTYRQALTRP